MNIKFIAAVVGGVGAGAALGWAVTADYYEKKLQEKEDYIEGLREIRRDLLSKERQNADVEAEIHSVGNIDDSHPTLFEDQTEEEQHPFGHAVEVVGPENPPEDETDETDDAGVEGETEEETRTHLQSLIEQYTNNPDDRDEFVNAVVKANNNTGPPHVISRETFSWDEDAENFSKFTYTYFPRARVLLDEDDEVIDDIANTVGWKNLNRFGEESGDDDVVFIRNPKMETDFEVVRDEESSLPLHVKYGLPREEFNVAKAAGTLKLRDEDM